jgi:hypothetical protein
MNNHRRFIENMSLEFMGLIFMAIIVYGLVKLAMFSNQ